jgi:apolipoprotein N-acyltransferase
VIRLAERYPVATALAAGLLAPLGFSPFDLFFVFPLALAWLFLVWLRAPIGRRTGAAFAFGVGMFSVGVSWVYVSLHEFGNMPMPLALLCVAGFVAVLSAYPALAAILGAAFRRSDERLQLLVAFPVLWVAAEFARNHLLTGFSWLQSGYGQVDTPLGEFGAVIGIHGVSLFTAICAGLVACALVRAGGRSLPWLLAIAVPVGCGYLVSRMEWTQPVGKPVTAALVQGNVPLSTKWNLRAANEVAYKYLALSRQAGNVDLIIWPESPLPFFIDQMGERFYDQVLSLPAPLLSGFLERRPTADGGFDYFNSAILFTDPVHIYRKQHLVPFGEYTPLPGLFEPIIDYFQVPMSVLSPWPGPQGPIPVAGHSAGVSICYEDAFPGDIRRYAEDSDFLINITEDAWFGNSLAPWQRLQMARMRAIETGRPMFRASNTGLATLIDYRGGIVDLSPLFEERILEGALQPRTGVTPYVRYGDLPVLVFMAFCLLISGAVARGRNA